VKPRTQAAPITVSSEQPGLLHTYYTGQFSAALLHAVNVKQLFCITVCFLMMLRVWPKHVGAGVLNITAILIKLCALAGSNLNSCAFVGVTKVSGTN